MILTLDIGNTNIKCALFEDDRLKKAWRMSTDRHKTHDEYGVLLSMFLKNAGYDKSEIEGVIMSSVVPTINYTIEHMIDDYFGVEPIQVVPGIKTGINIHYDNPQALGADRICNAVAAQKEYGGPCIYIDFGTATTYDYVDESGAFQGGITAPGIRISAKALWEDAAKLPEIEIKKPASILGKDTITSMQAGLVYGQIGQTEYIINRVKAEVGLENIKTVVTGGLGRIIANETDAVDIYDPNLTLKGINLVYKKQNRKIK